MSELNLIHLAADLSHYHTDYLWKLPGSWEGYPYYSSPEFYEDIARTAARGIMDLLFFGDSGHAGRLWRQPPRRRALRHQVAAPRHDADDPLHVARGERRRLRHYDVDDLPSPVSHRAGFQRARPCHQRPHRLERRDFALEERSGELRLQKNDRARRALRARAGASAGLLRPLGQHRAGRHRTRPRERHLRRSSQSALAQFRRRVLQRARAAARPALAPTPACDYPSRPIRTGHGSRRPLRRPAILHAAHHKQHESPSDRARWTARQFDRGRTTAAFYGRCAYKSPIPRNKRGPWRSTISIRFRRKPG